VALAERYSLSASSPGSAQLERELMQSRNAAFFSATAPGLQFTGQLLA
jgi:hypothetical protein